MARRKKKKVNSKLLIIMGSLFLLLILGALGYKFRGLLINPETCYNKALAHAAASEYRQASRQFLRAISSSGRKSIAMNSQYRHEFAELLVTRVRNEKGLTSPEKQQFMLMWREQLEAVLRRNPDDKVASQKLFDFWWARRLVGFQNRQIWDNIIEQSKTAMRQEPGDVDIYLRRSDIFNRMSRADTMYRNKSVLEMAAAVACQPDNAETYGQWLQILLAEPGWDKAAQVIRSGSFDVNEVFASITRVYESISSVQDVSPLDESTVSSLNVDDVIAMALAKVGEVPMVRSMQMRLALLRQDFSAFETHSKAMLDMPDKSSSDLRQLANLLVAAVAYKPELAEKNYDQARMLLAQALELDAESLENYAEMSSLLIRLREYDQAEQLCVRGLALVGDEYVEGDVFDPQFEYRQQQIGYRAQFNLDLCRMYLIQYEGDPREQWLDKMAERMTVLEGMSDMIPPLEKGPSRGLVSYQVQIAMFRAMLAIHRGDDFKGEKLLRQVYDATDGSNIQVSANLAALYVKHKQYSAASRVLNSILARDPNNIEMLMKLADLQVRARETDPLNQTIEKLLRLDLDPQQTRRVNSLHGRLRVLNQEKIGSVDLPEIITPEMLSYWLENASRMQEVGEPDQAEKIYLRLAEQFPDDTRVISSYVLLLVRQDGNTDRAKEFIDNRIALFPESKQLKLLKAMVLAPADRQTEVYLEFIQSMPDSKEKELSLAKAYKRRGLPGDDERYCEHLEKVIAIDPAYGGAFDSLFSDRLMAKDIDKVNELVEMSKELNLYGVGGDYYRARMLAVQEKYTEALDVLASIFTRREYFSEAYTLQGQIFQVLQRNDEAQESYEKAWSQNNTNTLAVMGLAQMAELQGRVQDHKKWIYKAWVLVPMDSYVRSQWLRYHFDDVSPQQFIQDCYLVSKRYPQDKNIKLMLASSYRKLRPANEDRAEAIYRDLYATAQGDTERIQFLGLLMGFLQSLDRYSEASELLTSAEADGVDQILIDLLRVNLFRSQDKIAESYELLKTLLADNPEQEQVLQTAARWCMSTGQHWDMGVVASQKLLTLHPDNDGLLRDSLEMLLRAGQFEKAEKQLTEHLQAKPDDTAAMALLAQSYLSQKQTDKALELCDKIIQVDSGQVKARLIRAEIYRHKGKLDLSFEDIQQAYNSNPSEELAVRLAQKAFEVNSDGVKAKEVLIDALSRYEGSSLLLQVLAQYQMSTLDWAGMEDTLHQARVAYPKGIQWPVLEARMWSRRQQYARQVQALTAAMALADGTEIGLKLEYLRALLMAGQYTQAMEEANAVKSNSPSVQCRIKAIIGRAYLGLGDEVKGLQELRQAMLSAANTDDATAILNLMVSAKGTQTEEILKSWLGSDNDSSVVLVLTSMWSATGRQQEAIDLLTATDIDSAPEAFRFDLLQSLGMLYYDAGDNLEARKNYEKALEFNADSATVLNNLAYLLSDGMGDHEAAIEYAARAAELVPSDPSVADTLGWIYFRAGKLDKAEAELLRAIDLRPMPAAFYHLGTLYETRGNTEKAMEIFRNGFDLVRGRPGSSFFTELSEKVNGG